MNRTVSLFIAAGFFLLLLSVGDSAAQAPGQGGTPRADGGVTLQGGAAIKSDQLTRDQFHQLSDSAVIDLEGRQITAGELRAQMQRQIEQVVAGARGRGTQGQRSVKLKDGLTPSRQQALLRSSNTKVQGALALRRQQAMGSVQALQGRTADGGAAAQASPGQAVQGLSQPYGTSIRSPGDLQFKASKTPPAAPTAPGVSGTIGSKRAFPELAKVLSCSTPRIDKVEGLVMPGGLVNIYGCGFGGGNERGTIRLVGNFPGGFLVLTGGEWFDDFAAGVLPTVSGVVDQRAKIQLTRRNQPIGEPYAVQFTATREHILLPYTAIPTSCGDAAWYNSCNERGFKIMGGREFDCSGWSFCGSHNNQHPRQGTIRVDAFNLTLKNGWVFDTLDYWYNYSILKGQPSTISIRGFEDGPANVMNMYGNWSLAEPWVPGQGAYVNYQGHIYIVGPLGVPYQ